MKAFFFILSAIFMSASTYAADPAPSLTASDRTSIERMVRAYVKAFDKADFAALKKEVTPEFIGAVGGEEHFKKQLKDKSPVKEPRKIEDIHIVQKPVGIFVQFNIARSTGHDSEIMEDDDWFRIVKIGSGWKIQRHEIDFPIED